MKELFVVLLKYLGIIPPTVDDALAPLLKVRKDLILARDGHKEKANDARDEAKRQEEIAKVQSRQMFRATKFIENINKDLEE